jgi:hypothetical protein
MKTLKAVFLKKIDVHVWNVLIEMESKFIVKGFII